MTKIYILDKDYQEIIQDDIRDTVITSDTDLLREAEKEAVMQMISYLNARFDVSALFPAYKIYNINHLYLPGDFVDYQGTFVRAMEPTDTDPDPNRNKLPAGTNLSADGQKGTGIYWTDKCFPNVKTWDAAEDPVAVGQYRLGTDNNFYRCEVAHTNEDPTDAANIYDPEAETGYWTLDDPRDALLVGMCCRISLYKLHARISPDQIPELRIQDYDQAVSWLKGTAKGDISPLLPKIDPDETNSQGVEYGSIKKRKYDY